MGGMGHRERGTFSWWFWSSIYAATGFTPEVVEEVKGGTHRTYEIPERRLDEVTWAERARVRELIEDIGEHLAVLKEWNEERRKMEEEKVTYPDYLTRKKHQLLRDRVKATRPCLSFFYLFFEELLCHTAGILTLDPALTQFRSLKHLSLTGNALEVLDYLPDTLEVLSACGNRIREVRDMSANKKLQHIGLSFNLLTDLTNLVPHSVRPISPSSPDAPSSLPVLTTPPPASPTSRPYLAGLFSLDVGYNHLCHLSQTVEQLATLPSLIALVLQGNPLALVPKYRQYVLHWLPGLQTLDDLPVSPEERDAVDRLPSDAVDAALPEYSEVTLTIGVGDLCGMNADPDRPPVVLEADAGKGKKGKDAAKKKEAGKDKPGGKGGKKGEEDPLADVPVRRETLVYVECQLAGQRLTTPECPKPAAVVAPDGAEPEPLPPIRFQFQQRLALPPSVEVRDALLRPVTFHLWEVFRTITSDAEHPEEGPKVETETKRLGQFDVSFADTLFQRKPALEHTVPMQGNEFIHVDRLRELKRKQRTEQEAREREQAAREEAEKAKALLVEETPATVSPAASNKKGKPAPKPKPAAKAAEPEPPPEPPPPLDRYYNPCDLDVRLTVMLELNPKPPEPPPVEDPLEATAGKGRGAAKKGAQKKK